MNNELILELADRIKLNQIGVIPTDTVYGVIGSASSTSATEAIYRAKNRSNDKPFILLISSLTQLNDLGIEVDQSQKKILNDFWPGPVSVVLPSNSKTLMHIHRGNNSIAVRLPDLAWLKDLIDLCGPIVATSANLSGKPSSDDLDKIRNDLPGLDFYISGNVSDKPSKLARIDQDGSIEWLRL